MFISNHACIAACSMRMNCFALSWSSFHGRLRRGHGHASSVERNDTRFKIQLNFLKLDTVTTVAKRALKSPAVVCSFLGSKGDPRVEAADVDTNRALSMREYEDLKALLLRRTWRFGTLFSLYLLLSVSAKAAMAELVGVGGSYAYLLWLMHDIDAYGPDSKVGMQSANAVEPAVARFIARLVAAYAQALSPRLLIPASLVGIIWIWNTLLPEFQLNLAEEGCMIGGFLSYKVALILKVYDDLKPRPLTEEEMLQLSRPQLVDIEDVPLYIPKGPSTEPNDEKCLFNDE